MKVGDPVTRVMFAHEIILAKEGPLARIWLAAHWDKKLKKKDIFETKLVESVENIINPRVSLDNFETSDCSDLVFEILY